MKDSMYQYFKMRKMTMSFFGRSQYTDWRIIVAGACIGFVLVSLCGIYFYFTVDEWDFFSADVVVHNEKIDQQVLVDMIAKVEDKQKRFEDLNKNRPIVSDPSIPFDGYVFGI